MGVTQAVFVFGAALGVAVLMTPVLRTLAARFGWVDQPAVRKSHQRPMPLLGGVAIYAGVVVALALRADLYPVRELGAILIGASLVSLSGLWDDRRGLRPSTKLAIQALAAALLVAGGVEVALPVPAPLNVALSLLWVLGVTNALNLLDNVDGLAGGVASIAAFFFLWLAILNGQYLVGSLAAALLGASLGFLLYNFNPASIFMGDTGSLFLGFLLAAVGIKVRFPQNIVAVTWLVPILILAVPLVDTGFVVVTRTLRGVNPLTTPGRDHLSHRLMGRGLSARRTVTVLYLAAVGSGLAGVVVSMAPPSTAYAIGTAAAVVAGGSCLWLARDLAGERAEMKPR